MISHKVIVKIFFPLSKEIWEYFVFPLIEFVDQSSTLHVSSSTGRILVQVRTTQIHEFVQLKWMSLFNSNRWVYSTQITWVVNSNRWVCSLKVHESLTLIDKFIQLNRWGCSYQIAWCCITRIDEFVQLKSHE